MRDNDYDEWRGAFWYYFIKDNHIDWCHECIPENNFISFTLEEFLEKFPYKVGDKVIVEDCISPYTINDMIWEDDTVKYRINCEDDWLTTDELQPYKEKNMEETIKIDIPKGYEFAGVDDNAQQVVFQKIRPQYPKTYEECCEVLKTTRIHIEGLGLDEVNRIKPFIQLLRCRDAYWKLVGEQMGLDKPWKPNWECYESYYCIFCDSDEIVEKEEIYSNTILAFPTTEMRDAFHKNFKELIEECKEFL